MRPSRRSRLAAPFVITVASLTGCAPAPQTAPNPPQPPPEPTSANPPPPEPHVNPPPPPQPVADLPAATDPAQVRKQPDGSCVEWTDSHCPPSMKCNPPPPHPVRCPTGK